MHLIEQVVELRLNYIFGRSIFDPTLVIFFVHVFISMETISLRTWLVLVSGTDGTDGKILTRKQSDRGTPISPFPFSLSSTRGVVKIYNKGHLRGASIYFYKVAPGTDL